MVYHEVMHLALFSDRKCTQLENLAQDAVINVYVARLGMAGAMRSYYSPQAYPYLFLRPGSCPARGREKIYYRSLYKGSRSVDEMAAYFSEKGSEVDEEKLIGGLYGDLGEEIGEARKTLGDVLGDIVSGKDDKIPGCLKDVAKEQLERLVQKGDKEFFSWATLALDEAITAKVIDYGRTGEPERTVVPPNVMTRGDAIKTAQGWPMIFFETPGYVGGRANVYLDVSGSMSRKDLAWVYSIVAGLTMVLDVKVYLFSNVVVALSMGELERGEVTTTGGTDFDCVLDHVEREGIRAFMLVTDGHAYASKDKVERYKKSGARCVGVLLGKTVNDREIKRLTPDVFKKEREE